MFVKRKKSVFLSTHHPSIHSSIHPSIPHYVLVAIGSLRPLPTNLLCPGPPLYIVDNCDHSWQFIIIIIIIIIIIYYYFPKRLEFATEYSIYIYIYIYIYENWRKFATIF
jgi:hypothetical protein